MRTMNLLTRAWRIWAKALGEKSGRTNREADKIAYINHDIEDSIRAGIISESDLPKDCIEYFTSIQSKRLSRMINEIVNNSMGKPTVAMGEEAWGYTTKLREWLFQNVYTDSPAKFEEKKAKKIIEELFNHYVELLTPICPPDKVQLIACDYISGMTDRYAVKKFKENFIPKPMVNTTNDDYLFRLAKMID